LDSGMPRQDRPAPKSYDEIVRRTVPDLDSSRRPTERQEQQAREGFRAMDAHEQKLHARVVEAVEDVLALTNAPPAVDIEVDRETVTLRGHARDMATIEHLERAVAEVDGVEQVVNKLVVGT